MKANRLSKLSRKGCALKILTSLVLNRISFALIFLFSFLPQESCFAYADQKLDPKLLKINTSMQTLERASNGIESEQNIFMERIQEKEKEVARLRQALNDLISQNREIEAYSRVELAKSLEDVTNIWRGSADRLLDLYFSPDFSELALLPDPFLFDSLALKGLPSDIYQSFLEYQKNYENAGLRRKDLVRIRSRLIEEIKARTFHLLNSAGEKRASLLASCDQIDCPRPRGINESNILDIIREFRIVPLKFLSGTLAKWIEIKAKFFSGLDGWIDISRQIILLIILLLIPVGLIFSLDRVSRYLDGWRRNLVAQAVHDRPYYTRLAMWIVRCNPFIPFLGMIVSIEVCQSLLRGTDLRELANFLFYFELYYLYRCFRLLLGLSLDFIFSTSSIGELKNQEIRIEQSAARISRLIFFEYGLLHMTQETVRQALAYHLFASTIFWINILVCFVEAYRWKKEITQSFRARFARFSLRLSFFESSRWSFLIYPFFFFSVGIYDLVEFSRKHLLRTDLVKWLHSEVLRKKLERTDQKGSSTKAPPDSYLNSFDYYLPASTGNYVRRDNSATDLILKMARSWLFSGSGENLILLVGNRGLGKSTVLNRVYQSLENQEKRWGSIPPSKILDRKALLKWMSEVLACPLSSVEEFIANDSLHDKPLVLCIDDIQNLFLSRLGGFEAYRLFLEIIGMSSSRIFWMLTINQRSWEYLKGVFGSEHFYGKILKLEAWKDFEIQSLVLARHQSSGFIRKFDNSIKAYSVGGSIGQQAETQFFRLLWGQSRGNPRAALMYWVSAISYEGGKQIDVGIPTFVNSSQVASLSDESLFVLAAISRHDSLNSSELCEVTGVEETIVKKCLKNALENNLIWMDMQKRARVSSKAQYVIDYYLTGKNFLYE